MKWVTRKRKTYGADQGMVQRVARLEQHLSRMQRDEPEKEVR
jgi:hypothetical protein